MSVEGDAVDDRGEESGVGEDGAAFREGRLVAVAMLVRSARSVTAR
ncbi:MAG: hypothetical protein WA962_03405 [Ornithinimicrobium sp.]